MSNLNNYFMKPQIIEGIGFIYPIKIYDYEEFRTLFNLYMLLDIQSIKNKQTQEDEPVTTFDNLFDYLIDKIEKDTIELNKRGNEDIEVTIRNMFKGATDEQYIAIINNNPNLIKECLIKEYQYRFLLQSKKNICEIIKKTVNNEVLYNKKNRCFEIIKVDNDKYNVIGEINKNNFSSYRQMVMEQNLFHEPLIVKDKLSQEHIDKDIARRSGKDEFDLEAVIAFVSVNSNIDCSDYTYYRLMADFYMINRTIEYKQIGVYRANGCKDKNNKDLQYPNLTGHLTMNDNPYSRESIFRESKFSKLDMELL